MTDDQTETKMENDENSNNVPKVLDPAVIVAHQYIQQIADVNYEEGLEEGIEKGKNIGNEEAIQLFAKNLAPKTYFATVKLSTRFKSPKNAFTALNKLIVGQDDAKKILISSMNTTIQNYLSESPIKSNSHVLLAGPENTGKEMLVRGLAKVYGVPFVKIPFQDFKDYEGVMTFDHFLKSSIDQNLGQNIKTRLVSTSKGTVEEQYFESFKKNSPLAVIYFDGLDQFISESISKASIDTPYYESKFTRFLEESRPIRELANKYILTNNNMLFVGAGSFPRLQKIIERRIIGKHRCGFTPDVLYPDANKYNSNKPFEHATIDDFTEFGFSKRFMGDLSNMVFTNKLSKEDFAKILSKKSSYLKEKISSFDKKLEISLGKCAIDAIAQKLVSNNSNAGGIRQAVDKVIDPLYYRPDNSKVNIDKKYVNKYLTNNLFNPNK